MALRREDGVEADQPTWGEARNDKLGLSNPKGPKDGQREGQRRIHSLILQATTMLLRTNVLLPVEEEEDEQTKQSQWGPNASRSFL